MPLTGESGAETGVELGAEGGRPKGRPLSDAEEGISDDKVVAGADEGIPEEVAGADEGMPEEGASGEKVATCART